MDRELRGRLPLTESSLLLSRNTSSVNMLGAEGSWGKLGRGRLSLTNLLKGLAAILHRACILIVHSGVHVAFYLILTSVHLANGEERSALVPFLLKRALVAIEK